MVARDAHGGRSSDAPSPRIHWPRIVGINVDVITATTFALSSGLGAVAGVLFALNVNSALLGMGYAIEAEGPGGDHRGGARSPVR